MRQRSARESGRQVECPYRVAGNASALSVGSDIRNSAYCRWLMKRGIKIRVDDVAGPHDQGGPAVSAERSSAGGSADQWCHISTGWSPNVRSISSSSLRPPSMATRTTAPSTQGLTLAHFRAQLEDLRDTSLTLELNLSTFGTHPPVNLGIWGTKVRLR
jgi:hypothetical protein